MPWHDRDDYTWWVAFVDWLKFGRTASHRDRVFNHIINGTTRTCFVDTSKARCVIANRFSGRFSTYDHRRSIVSCRSRIQEPVNSLAKCVRWVLENRNRITPWCVVGRVFAASSSATVEERCGRNCTASDDDEGIIIHCYCCWVSELSLSFITPSLSPLPHYTLLHLLLSSSHHTVVLGRY
jgi:hypothetical protein